MNLDLLTIQYSKIENFPFVEGEKVLICWTGFPAELGTIHKLSTSVQHGHKVVDGVMVLTESSPCKPFAVSPAILKKIKSNKR